MTNPQPLGAALVPPAPPAVTPGQAERIAAEAFGTRCSAQPLGSHQDRNFVLHTSEGKFILKIANPGTTVAELEAQSKAAALIAERMPRIRVPLSRPIEDSRTVATVQLDGAEFYVRMLDFIEGSTLSRARYLSPRTARALGQLAADVDTALATMSGLGVERSNQWDLRRAPEVLGLLWPYVPHDALGVKLMAAADEAWRALAPLVADLPRQVVHGDLTDDNVVTVDPRFSLPDGVIDFGDLNVTWTVAELAVTVASTLHHARAGMRTVGQVVVGYHERRPLSRPEAAAVWPLVVLRAATLVASGHHVTSTDPDNAYAAENLEHEQTIARRALEVPLKVGTALVLSDAGYEVATPRLPRNVPLAPALAPETIAVLDFSATSPLLHDGRWLDDDAEADLAAEALAGGAAAALTRFAEPRLTRSRPYGRVEPENVALGIELTVAVPVELVAPWAGRVEMTADGVELHGEDMVLKLAEVEPLGEPFRPVVEAGSVLGRCSRTARISVHRRELPVPWHTTSELALGWQSVAADPTSLLLGTAVSAVNRDPSALIARRDRVYAPVQEHYYDEPPMIVRGWREYLIDANGRVYLDLINNVTSIGHGHPRLSHAVTEQWSMLNTNSRFNYPAVVEFSERLSALLPESLDSVFLVNSGSEAVDLALRLARAATGRREVMAVREAYHGWTDLSDSVSTSIADNPDAPATRPAWVHTIDAPNVYRGRYRGSDAGQYAVGAVAEIDRLAAKGTPIGAFIAEPYYGNAGGIALPDGYLTHVYAAVRRHGGVAVADEVQVGYGRLGEWFWGFEQQGVVPDIVAVAKAMGNGHPLGAVVTTQEIAARFRTQGYFFSSAGGSPVSSMVGLTVLDVIRDEHLQENARSTGAYLRERLLELTHRYPLIGAVHGSGFYLGLELVRDRDTLEPATAETSSICERLRELGVIVQPTSDRQCVLKIKPPMCLTTASADAFITALDEVLSSGW